MAGEPRATEGRTIGVLRQQLAEARAERDEARARETALSEVLRAVNASSGDLQPVFETILERATRLCEAAFGIMWRYDGDLISLGATHRVPQAFIDFASKPFKPAADSGPGRIMRGEGTFAVADMREWEPYKAGGALPRAIGDLAGSRSFVIVPLRRGGITLGSITLYRQEVRPFTPREISLVESFAAQAEIAMENARLLTEQREALDQQTATTEVLEVINASPGDLAPVFDAMLEKAMHLCEAAFGMFYRFDGGTNFDLVAHRGVLPSVVARANRIASPPPDSGLGRMISGEPVAQIVDLPNTDLYRSGFIGARLLVEAGANTAIFVALRGDEALQGAIIMYRTETRAFSDKQVALLQTFAAQAVIAMENARLLTEQREALEQQTATADILRVISQSPTDVNPVLQAVAKAAVRFCGAPDAVIILRDGDHWESRAHEGPLTNPVGRRHLLSRDSGPGRAIIDRQTMHFPDIAALDPVELAGEITISQQLGFRAALIAPMVRDGHGVGAIGLRKSDVGAFSPHQIQLLETFAAQAVIALENTRLFTELRESLEQQTATAEILQAISRSPTDVQPVLDAVVKAAVRFCGALDAVIVLREGEQWTGAAHEGPLGKSTGRMQPLNRETAPGRSMIDRRTIHYPDIGALDPAEHGAEQANAARMGFSSVVAAPLLRDNESLGAIALRKREAEPFTPRQIALLESFTAQAVIALENVRLFTELGESLEQQTATTEVLQTINRSPGDLTPVFEAILDKAMTLCGAAFGLFNTFDGEHFRTAATKGVPEAYARFRVEHPPDYSPGTGPARLMAGEDTFHVVDMADSDLYRGGDPNRLSIVDLGGARSILNVALRREDALLGMIAIYRQEVRPFTDKQIALVKAFADQAVIAMENARLLGELRETLEQQTATADILRVISQSPTDVQPVLDVVVKSAQRFCGADDVVISLRDGDELAIAAHDGPIASPPPRRSLDRSTAQGRAVIDAATVHLPDIGQLDPAEWESVIALSAHAGSRSSLAAPMLREGAAIGAIMLRRREVGAFTERQIALLEAFAAQAVIAIENVRLFTELRESLEYQTATSQLLEVISRSASDIQPVFDTMLASAARLCGVQTGDVAIRRGEVFRHVAFIGATPEQLAWLKSRVTVPGRGTSAARALLTRQIAHVLDQSRDPERVAPKEATRERTTLAVPLLRDGEPVGVISLLRDHVEPFSERQITLIKTFADQAVIAMENARLLNELQQRTDDLTESLDYQTATAEVLGVISRSPTTLQPVLEAMTAAAVRLCGVKTGGLSVRRGDRLEFVALVGQTPEFERWQASTSIPVARGVPLGDAILDKVPVQIVDVMDTEAYKAGAEVERAVVELGGHRTILHVPLLREDEAIGVLTVSRSEPLAFTERQIGLIETFADQAVIAMENARLLSELRERTDDLTESLEYQTATSEVLEVIGRSTSDIQPVLDTMLSAALRLCMTESGGIAIQHGEGFRYVATLGWEAEADKAFRSMDITAGRGTVTARVLAEGRIVHVTDVASDAEYELPELAERAQWHTALGVPLMRDDRPIGVITITRNRIEPFTERQIALIKTFADQAVIAMENARLLGELRESLDQQTATTEVLAVINSSPGDLTPVFESMLEKAHALCRVEYGSLQLWDGTMFRAVAVHNLPEALAARLREGYAPGPAFQRLIEGEDFDHTPDVAEIDDPVARTVVDAGIRTLLRVALRKDGKLLGQIVAARKEVQPFADKEIALLQGFASQAVIAMENARLLGELRLRTDDLTESLEYQTATSEVLKVISRSTFELQLALDTLVSTAARLCETEMVLISRREGDHYRSAAAIGFAPEFQAFLQSHPIAPGRGSIVGRVALEKRVIQIEDVTVDPEYTLSEATSLSGQRSALGVPLLRENDLIGVIVLARRRVEPFTDRQIELMRTFADQAVIAMENTRLLGELRQRTDDLTESLEYQTATRELLEVISRSASDIQPVMDTILAAAARLCDTSSGAVAIRRDNGVRIMATLGFSPEVDAALRARNHTDDRTMVGRTVLAREVVHVDDLAADDAYSMPEVVRVARMRTALGVPLLRDGEPVGAIVVSRDHLEPFGERQIALFRTFADQAVIAMENARLLGELRESLDRQTATAEVLQVINSSPGDVQPVFEVILAKAMTLCDAAFGMFATFDGERLHTVATHGVPEAFARFRRSNPPAYGPGTGPGRLIAGEDYVHDIDAAGSESYRRGDPNRRAIVDLGGARTILNVALRKDGVLLGGISMYRQEVRPFSDSQIALLQGFASQAVIAMDNARLLGELRERTDDLTESLEYQTATSELLEVISRSGADIQPVFDALAESSVRLCGADHSIIFRFDGELLRLVTAYNTTADFRKWVEQHPIAPGRHSGAARAALERRTIHIADVHADAEYSYGARDVEAIRSILAVPILKGEELLGVFMIFHLEVKPFTDKQIRLIETFADQAAIAIENARLLSELRDRQAELRVTFDNMGDGVVMFDADLRLAAWNKNFQGLLDVPDDFLASRPGLEDYVRLLVGRGELGDRDPDKEVARYRDRATRRWSAERTRPDGRVLEVRNNPVPGGGAVLIYSDVTRRKQAEAEIRAARDAAEEALERQTAAADILKVISSSPTDVRPVLDAIVSAALRFSGAEDAVIVLREGNETVVSAHEGTLSTPMGLRRQAGGNSITGRAIFSGTTVHIPDIDSVDRADFADSIALSAQHGWSAAFAVPMMREGTAVGAIMLRKTARGPFTPRHIEMAETFAAQAVIAIENVRLFTELRDSLERLKAAQANLVQSEKMASLGQLTAGIAHEIKNPLNFVNNFAGLSVELLDELREVAGPALDTLERDKRAELDETMQLLVGNLQKIAEHGKRADGIVKSMLSHSRGGSGDWAPSDINALVEEALNLAYHGARAQDKEFNVSLERDFAKESKPIEVVPQDVTRVFLNLFGNGFYAANKRRMGAREQGFRPTIKVSTRDLGEMVEVRVRDNGTGIPPEVREKLFQPFFTTKPTGEGTGLGLSISYDIVTQQHGGTIEVESEPGNFTEFTVRLPRSRRAQQSERA